MARLPYLDRSDLLPEHQDLLARNLNPLPVLAHSPRAARSLNTLARFIRDGSRLDPEVCAELAILQVAYLTDRPGASRITSGSGAKLAFSDDDIRAVADETGGRPTELEPAARASTASGPRNDDRSCVSDETFSACAKSSTTSV